MDIARWRLRAFACWLVLAAVLLAGCTVKYVADYDQASVDKIGAAYERMDKMYESLLRAEPAERTYDKFEAEWSGIATDLRVIALRQKTRADNEESQTVTSDLVETWRVRREAHARRSAEKPDDAYPDSLIALHRSSLEAAFAAAMAAERFKQ
jgi:hypothetical protein